MMRLGDFVVHDGATTTHSCPAFSISTCGDVMGSHLLVGPLLFSFNAFVSNLVLNSITGILHASMLPKLDANTTAFLTPWQVDASSCTRLSRKLHMTAIGIVGRGILPQLVTQPCGCCPSMAGHSRAQLVTLPHLSRIEHTKHCYPVIAHAFFFSSVSHFNITLFYLHTLPKPCISHRLRHVQLHHQSRLLDVLQ